MNLLETSPDTANRQRNCLVRRQPLQSQPRSIAGTFFCRRAEKENKVARRYSWLITIAMGLSMMAGTGCSSFHQEWKAASRGVRHADSMEGRWDGSWKSEKNGHSGRLRCLVTRDDSTNFTARFYANYWKIFTFGYTVPLIVEDHGTSGRFSGRADLGKLAGGVYEYQGEATGDRFFSTYRCSRDYGVFEMERPSPDE